MIRRAARRRSASTNSLNVRGSGTMRSMAQRNPAFSSRRTLKVEVARANPDLRGQRSVPCGRPVGDPDRICLEEFQRNLLRQHYVTHGNAALWHEAQPPDAPALPIQFLDVHLIPA